MKNYVNDGDRGTFIAPAGGVVSGAPVIIGDRLVIPSVTVAVDVEFTGMIVGTYNLVAVPGDVGDAGDKVYWDDAAKNITLAPAAGANKEVGTYAEAKLNLITTVAVRLNGIGLA